MAWECMRGDGLSGGGHSLLHVTGQTSIAFSDNIRVVAVAVRVTALAERRRPRRRGREVVMVIVTAYADPAILPQLLVTRSEEHPVGDANAEVIVAQGAGRNRGWHHDGTAGVGADRHLLVLRQVARAAGSVVQRPVESRMAAAPMTLPTCDSLAAVRPTRMSRGHLGVAGVAGCLAGFLRGFDRLGPPRGGSEEGMAADDRGAGYQ